MRVLLTGTTGQLGFELQRCVPNGVELLALDRSSLDLTDEIAIRRVVTSLAPEVVINAAAYTAVDRAESEPDVAFAINAKGPGDLARAAAAVGARIIHISTDFVFDGESHRSYRPSDAPHPVNVYGQSKLAGERAVCSAAADHAVIVRTAWLYSSHGSNFVQTILKLLASRESLTVVADQIGTPTWAAGLARSVWTLTGRPDLHGIFHWTDAGVASWYDFAVAIRDEALAVRILGHAAHVVPIRTQDYPTPARRPAFSVLDTTASWELFGCQPRHWRHSLRSMLEELTPLASSAPSCTSQPSGSACGRC